MISAFVDTSYLIALEGDDDQFHGDASRHWGSLRQSAPRLVTSTYVMNEVVTMFNSRGFHPKAVEIGNRLLQSVRIDLVHVGESLFLDGWEFLVRHQDKRYSLTDCISFVLMQQRGIDVAFTFDKHFVQAGFRVEPASTG